MARLELRDSIYEEGLVDADTNFIEVYGDVATAHQASGSKVSANDTTAGYLDGKLAAGANVVFEVTGEGADETLVVSNDNALFGLFI